jgi:hypothetical protein
MFSAQIRSQEFAADGANLSPGGQASGTAELPQVQLDQLGGANLDSWGGAKPPPPPGYGPVSACCQNSNQKCLRKQV